MPHRIRSPRIRPLAALALVATGLALGPQPFALLVRGAVALALESLPLLLLLASSERFARGTCGRGRSGRLAGPFVRGIVRSGCCGPGGAARAWSPLVVVGTGIAIGWPAAALRALAAGAIDLRWSGRRGAPPGDAWAGVRCTRGGAGLARSLVAIAEAGAFAGLALLAIRSGPAWLRDAPLGYVAGAAAGLLGPCGLGSIALAASSAHGGAPVSAGILATSGIVRPGLLSKLRRLASRSPSLASRSRAEARPPEPPRACDEPHDAGPGALSILAIICAVSASAGGLGLVSPHLTPLLWAGAVAGAMLAYRGRHPARDRECAHMTARRDGAGMTARRTEARRAAPRDVASALACAGALFAVVALRVSPPLAAAASLADGAPGERFAFTGRVIATGGSESVERWQVWCCVADAVPIAVHLTRATGIARGTWVRVSGRFVRTSAGLALAVERTERVAAPVDPYAYA